MTGKPNDWMVAGAVLSEALDLDKSRIRQMVEEGTLRPVKKDRAYQYPLIESVRSYVQRIRRKDPTKDDLTRRKLVAEVEYREAKAQGERLRTRQLRGELHDARDVKAATDQLVQTIKTMLVALPSRVAVEVMAANSAAEAAQIIGKETNRIQTELANFKYDPETYRQMVAGGEFDDE